MWCLLDAKPPVLGGVLLELDPNDPLRPRPGPDGEWRLVEEKG